MGGVGRLMANAILNFHFDFPHTSLMPFAFALIKGRAALFRVSTPFLCPRLLIFKKDGQGLEEVQKLELKGLILV